MNNKADDLMDDLKYQNISTASNCAAVDIMAFNVKRIIRDLSSYHGKRWKRGYWNQPGVYDIKLNIAQIQLIHRALQNIKYQQHLKKHWKDMHKEVTEDYNGRMVKHEQKNN